jgi:hypothetical protein
MSCSSGTRDCCHHRTSGTESSEEDRQQASCTSRSARFCRRCQYSLRRRANALARVDAGRSVLRLDCAVATDLGSAGSCSNDGASSRRWDHAQCWSRRALGLVSNCGRAFRAPRRRSRISTGRGPLRSVASDLCRNGCRLGLIPWLPRTADKRVHERNGVSRRNCRRCAGVDFGNGFRSPARPPFAGR